MRKGINETPIRDIKNSFIVNNLDSEDTDELLTQQAAVTSSIAESLARGKIVAMEYFPTMSVDTKEGIVAVAQSQLTSVQLSKIASLYVQGFTPQQIAAIIGETHRKVRDALKSEECQHFITEVKDAIKESAKDFLSIATVKAVKVFIDAMDSEDEKVRIKAAAEVLNRAGVKEVQEIKISKANAIEDFTKEELEELVSAGIEQLKSANSDMVVGDDE